MCVPELGTTVVNTGCFFVLFFTVRGERKFAGQTRHTFGISKEISVVFVLVDSFLTLCWAL